MELSIPSVVAGSESSSRKSSFRESIAIPTAPARKDSVIPFVTRQGESSTSTSSKSSRTSNPDVLAGTDRVRRLSRKLSLRPPQNVVFREKRQSFSGPYQTLHVDDRQHPVKCECGREFTVRCGALPELGSKDPSITLSTADVTDLKRAFENNQKNAAQKLLTEPEAPKSPSLHEVIKTMQTKSQEYDTVLQSCIRMGKIDDHESLEAVLSRQTAIKCLLDAINNYPDKSDLHLQASLSLLKQIQHSEASVHYLTLNDGIESLHTLMRKYPENTDILANILDIFGYISSHDEWRDILSEKVNHSVFLTTMAHEWRDILSEKVNHSVFLTTMARHDSDVIIVQKCCVVVSNLVISEDLARSLMYVGGVHSIISMMNKYSNNIDVLKHCCNALGTFASHDDTCQAVAEAGATHAVMTVMTSYPENATIQEGCCWALASLSRSDCACNELVYSDAFSALMKSMATFPMHLSIQEYGCWALCNLAALGARLDDADAQSAVEILIQNINTFGHNVELLEHICYAINTFVTTKQSVHETIVTRDGVSKLIELMRTFEENVDIHMNSMRVIGNLAVTGHFRRYLEDMGASEAIISCMLKQEKRVDIQTIGCITLTNLSADELDNKYRILKNGGVHAVLQAMTNFMDSETLQLNALKLLCNLLESDKGCWWIAEESGVQVITMTLKTYARSEDILTFGCTCLANIPRRGINVVVLESVEAALLYLRQSMSTSTDVAFSVCNFYENVLSTSTGRDCKRLFSQTALQKVLHILQDFNDIAIQRAGCKIIAQVALADDVDLLTREVTSQLITSMRTNMEDESIQIIGCGTISYLSSSSAGLELLKELGCIEIIIECMKVHQKMAEIQTVCMSSLKNIFMADLIRGKTIQSVCDAITKSLKISPDNSEIQLEGCHILSLIGNSFHKQNERRRKSLDLMEMPVVFSPRKSVTEEILEVASAAIQRIKRFKDDVLEDAEDGLSETELESMKHISESSDELDRPEKEREEQGDDSVSETNT